MTHKLGSIACMAVLALAGQVMADDVSITFNPLNYGNTANGGGAFIATPVTGGGYIGLMGSQTYVGPSNTNANNQSGSFLTFCLERSEGLSGSPFFATIGTGSVLGGYSGGNPDPISAATALLYRTFRAGTAMNLTPYGFGNNVVVDTNGEATALQWAIWTLEGEMAVNPIAANPLGQAMVAWANANNDGALHGVRVLNLWNTRTLVNGAWVYSDPRQSQLTIVPLPPAAYAGLGTLAGVIGLGYIRRRRLANA